MLKKLAVIAACALLAACASFHHRSEVRGWVSDANCGAAHVGGKNKSCVLKCERGGAHIGHPEWKAQPLIVVEDGTNRLVHVDNPAQLTGFEAQHVAVQLSRNGDAFHVERVTAVD